VTEAEWLACGDPAAMHRYLTENVGFLRTRWHGLRGVKKVTVSDRKWGLLGVACGRRVEHFLQMAPARELLITAEEFADGHRPPDHLWNASLTLRRDLERVPHNQINSPPHQAALAVRVLCGLSNQAPEWIRGYEVVAFAVAGNPDGPASGEVFCAELAAQAALLRDIVGNPFHRVHFDPAWARAHGGNAAQIARAIYDDRAFDRLPVLADALMDAGCTDAAVLDHCRGPGPHVRGCWVVDGVLGLV
jgi:hypothetical protein